MRAVPEQAVRRARRAVAALFVLNAVTYANVVPRLPAVKARLGLSNTALGTAVAAWPLGALASGVAAGWLIHRVGSRRVAVSCAVGFGVLLSGFAVAPSWVFLAALFLGFGSLDCLMDVSMNAHAIRVQRGHPRSIINGLHGMWSAGAILGGLLGTAAVAVGLPLERHLVVAGAAVVAVALTADRWMLRGGDDADRADVVASAADPGLRRARRRDARRQLTLLALLLVVAGAIEDAPWSWGAVLMRNELGARAATAGLVHVGFQVGMTVTRLLGDRIVDRLGAASVARVGGLVTTLGVGAGLAVGTPASVVVGFAVGGIGTGLLFPLGFAAAGRIPGVSTGHGVAVVATVARAGSLVTPPVIGFVADATNLRAGLAVVPIAGIVTILLAGALRGTRSGAGAPPTAT